MHRGSDRGRRARQRLRSRDEHPMEKLPGLIFKAAIIVAIVLGFLGGAVGHLFGFGFWEPAFIVTGLVVAFILGGVVLVAG